MSFRNLVFDLSSITFTKRMSIKTYRYIPFFAFHLKNFTMHKKIHLF